MTSFTGLEHITIPENVIFTGHLEVEKLKSQYRWILPSSEGILALVQVEVVSFWDTHTYNENTGGEDIIMDRREGFIIAPGETDPLAERSNKRPTINCSWNVCLFADYILPKPLAAAI